MNLIRRIWSWLFRKKRYTISGSNFSFSSDKPLDIIRTKTHISVIGIGSVLLTTETS